MNKIFFPLLFIFSLSTVIISCDNPKKSNIRLEPGKEQILGSSLFFNFPVKYSLSPEYTLENIKGISIRNKPLMSLNDIDFSKFPHLDTLSINNTLLIDVFPGSDSLLVKQIKVLDLSGNKISSDIGIVYFKNVNYLSLKNNFVIQFPNIDNFQHLEDLDLRDNYLRHIPEISIGSLKRLGLKGNPLYSDSVIQVLKGKYPELEVY